MLDCLGARGDSWTSLWLFMGEGHPLPSLQLSQEPNGNTWDLLRTAHCKVPVSCSQLSGSVSSTHISGFYLLELADNYCNGKWISEPRVSMVDFFIHKSKHWCLFSVVFECWVSDTTVQDWVTALCCLITAHNGARISNTEHQVFVSWRSWFPRKGKKSLTRLTSQFN